jgi:CheY-like chemotaxis protein
MMSPLSGQVGSMKTSNSEAETGSVQAAPATILLAEDEILIRWSTANDLRTAGFRVLEAGNAEEALAVLKVNPEVEVLLTDLHMPGAIDGLKLASLVREMYQQIKIIVISAHAPEWGGAHVLDGFIGKPCERARLIERVKSVLKGSA